MVDIVEHSEAFKYVDNKLSFHCVKGIIRIDQALSLAEWDNRFTLPTDATQLHILQQIHTQDRGPPVKEGWTVITRPHELEQQCHHPYYVKTPSIHAFYEIPDLQGLITREVETCELLKRHPHPNISPYLGCTQLRGRVSGLCFQKHHQTLRERVNPRGLNKTMFLGSQDRRLYVDNALKRAATHPLLGAIKHLHSLEIIHNHITPANIMLDEDGTLVLIDFDSCRRRGEPLGSNTKRTYGWHNPEITTATEGNDLNAFAELQTWLFGASVDLYQFP